MPQEREFVQSVNHAFDVISELIRTPRQTPNQLSKGLGISRTAVYRLLWTMESRGAVVANEERKYSLGPYFFQASIGRSAESGLIDLCLPSLLRLNEETKETVGIYVARNSEIICGEIVESPYELRRITRPGDPLPFTKGAVGKCYLAWRVSELQHPRDFLLGVGIEPDQIDEWEQRLKSIRDHGYAVSWGERVPGSAAVSVPIFRQDGGIVAAVAVSGPIGRITQNNIEEFVAMVKRTAQEIQHRMST